ncbi:GPR endopeptidase [Jeotgalibacillus sp. R-1-5s-1]|uniref:GPR endopeptidase n=1 Tax=Jeotgalibacillus sp. R-1-5s-1 TaxID=2555897 RepID=UPI00106DA659|nr:GPR endopeptidase [Jeotgalibacillus sp. R-1-5s-1]TFD92346.1 GPR endopeptidase [Jeotgalibacillus sp. R-1-5s-1]
MSGRTDLALEALEAAEQLQEMEKVEIIEEEIDSFVLKKVHITQQAGIKIGKKEGEYWTFEVPQLRTQNEIWVKKATDGLEKVIRHFFDETKIPEDAPVLIAGLGNWQITPDSLGPQVCHRIYVTNHLFDYEPEAVEDGYRRVTAIAPGVMGLTGMETGSILSGVVKEFSPGVVVVVDALAAKSALRIHSTVQISSAGIQPGAGVGNKRKEISVETLGVPVISIGIPTVVDAASITLDTLDYTEKTLSSKRTKSMRPSNALTGSIPKDELQTLEVPEKEKEVFLGVLGTLDEDEKRQLFSDILSPLGQNLIVTPKETDLFIEQAANMVASALNSALHPALKGGEGESFTH